MGIERDVKVESVKIGSVAGDFLEHEEWLKLIDGWVGGNRGRPHTTGIRGKHIVTLNPEMVMRAETDGEFRRALERADLRIPDGAGLIWARWYLRSEGWLLAPSLLIFLGQRVRRITGVEAVFDLAETCQRHQTGMYLLGGKPEAVKKTRRLLELKYPNLRIKNSGAHTADLSGARDILDDIIKFKPAVLLAAYGAPLQSLWIDKYLSELPSVKAAVGVGGAFEIIGEFLPRAPKWMRSINMEWLWRLGLEPKRWPRIKTAVIDFPLLVQMQKKRNLKE